MPCAARRTNLPLSQHTARASTPDAIADANESAKATPAVYKAVVIACLGAFLFGYHLGVVNGPLGQIAADLNFGDNVSLQGLVRPLAAYRQRVCTHPALFLICFPTQPSHCTSIDASDAAGSGGPPGTASDLAQV